MGACEKGLGERRFILTFNFIFKWIKFYFKFGLHFYSRLALLLIDVVNVILVYLFHNYFSDCDNFEDPKILWFRYHGFNPDIILFKNQHKQAKVRVFIDFFLLKFRINKPCYLLYLKSYMLIK